MEAKELRSRNTTRWRKFTTRISPKPNDAVATKPAKHVFDEVLEVIGVDNKWVHDGLDLHSLVQEVDALAGGHHAKVARPDYLTTLT